MPQAWSTWGLTEQEPLTWLTSQPWATRNQVPFGSYDATRDLDAIERAITLRWRRRAADDARPCWHHHCRGAERRTLAAEQSPVATAGAGLTRGEWPRSGGVVRIRSRCEAGRRRHRHQPDRHLLSARYRCPRVAFGFFPDRTAATVSGDSSALPILAGPHRSCIDLRGDLQADEPVPPTWIVTDTNQRRSTTFGGARDNRGYVLSPTDVDPIEKTKAKASFYPGDDIEDQTAAHYGTVEAVRASSYGSIWRPLPRDAPPRALDAIRQPHGRPASDSSSARASSDLVRHDIDVLQVSRFACAPRSRPQRGTCASRVLTSTMASSERPSTGHPSRKSWAAVRPNVEGTAHDRGRGRTRHRLRHRRDRDSRCRDNPTACGPEQLSERARNAAERPPDLRVRP